ncbi:ubiquitin-like protein ATG12 [Apostichopus japonicus]|uniref:ubiquitin-like protein ATG12 n=1 Tax=Stichopus japonicus TaxID=307972 RepID=UPI003AB803D8
MDSEQQPDEISASNEPTSPSNNARPVQSKSDKVDILLKATGDAPILKKKKWAVPGDRTISGIIDFLKKYLRCQPSESVFLYVQQTFSPSPDQQISNLYECYGSDGKLVLHYCKSEAWG